MCQLTMYCHLLSTIWQSLVEFRLLTSICQAWQWNRMQNLLRVGKNAGRVFSCLWTKVRIVLRRCRTLHAVFNALVRLSISFLFKRYNPQNLPLSCKIVEKRGFWTPIFKGRVYPRFRSCILKSHLLPSMWPISVEFRSASSEGRWRKKKKERKKKNRGKT